MVGESLALLCSVPVMEMCSSDYRSFGASDKVANELASLQHPRQLSGTAMTFVLLTQLLAHSYHV